MFDIAEETHNIRMVTHTNTKLEFVIAKCVIFTYAKISAFFNRHNFSCAVPSIRLYVALNTAPKAPSVNCAGGAMFASTHAGVTCPL